MATKAKKKDAENSELQSGAEAVAVDTPENESENAPKKKSTFEQYTIRDSETARERGRKGGVKSGETRRAQRDARETIRYMLNQMTKAKNVHQNLEELGFEKTEFTNMAALQGRLFTMAMGGNLEAYLTLMKMGGFEPEEVRKERESLNADRRREIEVNAKIEALGQRGPDASVSLAFDDEDDHDDVVVYMPQMATEDSCQMPPENEDGDKSGEE